MTQGTQPGEPGMHNGDHPWDRRRHPPKYLDGNPALAVRRIDPCCQAACLIRQEVLSATASAVSARRK